MFLVPKKYYPSMIILFDKLFFVVNNRCDSFLKLVRETFSDISTS